MSERLMTSRLELLILLSISIISGCASAISSIPEEKTKAIDPIGLYVIASTPLLFKDDYKHNNIVIRSVTNFMSGLLAKKGYQTKQLNAKVKKAEVFEKYSFYFDVDQKRIAEVGRREGCASVLIVYLSYTGNGPRLKSGLKVYRECSIYGWLVDTANGNTISSIHAPPKSFEEFLENGLVGRKERPELKVYRRFLINVVSEMFYRFPKRAYDK